MCAEYQKVRELLHGPSMMEPFRDKDRKAFNKTYDRIKTTGDNPKDSRR